MSHMRTEENNKKSKIFIAYNYKSFVKVIQHANCMKTKNKSKESGYTNIDKRQSSWVFITSIIAGTNLCYP